MAMESAVKLHNPLLLPLLPRPSSLSRPFSFSSSSSSSPRKPLLLRASHHPSPSTPISKALQTISISAAATVAAAAALLLARPHRSPFASLSATTVQSEPQPQTQPQPEFTLPEALADEDKEQALENHLASYPDDVKSLRALMEIKVRFRKLPDAVAVADRLILLEPGDADLPLLRSHFLFYNGDVEVAKEGFEGVLSTDPFVVEAYHGLVMAASKNEDELDGILNRVEEMMEKCKKDNRKVELRDFKLLKAQVKVIQGDYEEALEIYEGLVKEEPRDFRPYLCQGIIYTLLRKKEEAMKQFDKYRRLVPRGHPYAKYFEENMVAMGAMMENKTKASN
ncbi:protein SLOW GREEN 1, chloroplastic-like [Dioscorea cayenensis subsp. rotundata]|uniref:Protein SLOW GREEN 1, chloroplastic-like n=1 Tax=Dioscorea cayennensis subsp. rotundata TaxID=55577 RepID=A0AB40D278_DIOCR|nr:protein SLOW GREEN 1, chloroplastic-like [Dioscorea cayenensis subsp. rotundata]